jgi:hypothetical protein
MKKAYIQDHSKNPGAGRWIYEGYRKAWEQVGYEAEYFETPSDFDKMHKECLDGHDVRVMMTDSTYNLAKQSLRTESANSLQGRSHQQWCDIVGTVIEKATIYLFAQPNNFPMPWGAHPNFNCHCAPEFIEEANSLDNIKLWSFGDAYELKREYYPLWKNIKTVPLAFDSVSYEYLEDDKYKFDVCFVGGRANNGYDEKYKIMMNHFSAFKNSGLKCGIFVEKNLTHEQENKLLYNSKVAINIHDAYQRELRLDTNERTFKGLGLTGVLVSDDEGQLERLFPDVKRTNDPEEMVKFVKEYVNMPEEQLNSIKEKNRKMILENHTYIHRVQQLLKL